MNPTYSRPQSTSVARPSALTSSGFTVQSENSRGAFVSRVYALLTVTLIIASVGATFGLGSLSVESQFWSLLFAELGLLVFTLLVRRVPILNLVALLSFCFVSGLTTAPLLTYYISSGMGHVIVEAGVATAAVFGSLSLYIHLTKRDFSWMENLLFVALVLLIFTGLAVWVFGKPLDFVLLSAAGIVIFSLYILYDTSNLYHRYTRFDSGEVIEATLDLYLDVINLFLDVLNVLSFFSGND